MSTALQLKDRHSKWEQMSNIVTMGPGQPNQTFNGYRFSLRLVAGAQLSKLAKRGNLRAVTGPCTTLTGPGKTR